jgi:hypothetical protein
VKRWQWFLTLPVRLSSLLVNQINPINKINKRNHRNQRNQTNQKDQNETHPLRRPESSCPVGFYNDDPLGR